MTNYRRNLVPGGSFFFTVNLLDRRSTLLTDHVQLLRDAFRYTQLNHPFTIDAIVVLPDHLHAIWTLPEGVSDFASRWRLIKPAFSRALPSGGHVSRSRATKAERGVWQRRYWGHTLGDEIDLSRHVDYIHFNPIRHGYADEVWQWPYSSFRRMVRLGVYPRDWAGDGRGSDADFGER
jgi:putative transposase